jgi:hypothetical protein
MTTQTQMGTILSWMMTQTQNFDTMGDNDDSDTYGKILSLTTTQTHSAMILICTTTQTQTQNVYDLYINAQVTNIL